MSYDFRIVGSERLNAEDLQALLKEFGWQLLHGGADVSYFSFGKSMDNLIGCDIKRLNEQDLEEAWIQMTLVPKWAYVLTVPLIVAKSERTRVGEFAKRIAEIIRGAVFDPQMDKILYPKGKKQRYIADLTQDRINVIVMEWFIPKEYMTEFNLNQFINQIEKILPEALPLRYGDRDPLAHVFRERKSNEVNAENRKDFVQFAMEQKVAENSIYWNSEQPCFLGSISFGIENFAKGREYAICDTIKLCLDARACNSDARWIQIIEELFLQVATELSAIYAMVHVDENIGVSKRGTLWYNGKEKRYPIPYYHWWRGIPGYPMWMSWFGKPYINLIEGSLKGLIYRKEKNGIYYNAGMDKPMIMEMAKLHFPQLPEQLLSIREYGYKPDGSLSEYNYEDIPAEVIPDIYVEGEIN